MGICWGKGHILSLTRYKLEISTPIPSLLSSLHGPLMSSGRDDCVTQCVLGSQDGCILWT
jgi:hypothetical protein